MLVHQLLYPLEVLLFVNSATVHPASPELILFKEPLQEAGLDALQKRLQLRNLLPLHIKYGIRMNYTKQLLI